MQKIQIVLGNSRALRIYFIFLFVISIFLSLWCCLHQPKNSVWLIPLLVFVISYIRQQSRRHATRTAPSAIVGLEYDESIHQWHLRQRSGMVNKATLFNTAMLTTMFILLHFKVEATKRVSVLIWQDALPAVKYRETRFFLNIILTHAESQSGERDGKQRNQSVS